MPLKKGFLNGFVYPDVDATFIETGMHRGDGIQQAIMAGFQRIYSCDRSAFALGWCSHRFRNTVVPVNLHLQDSREFLREMRGVVGNDPAVIWLDAHFCGGNGEVVGWGGLEDAGHEEDHPLLQELKILTTFGTRDNTLLIDDVRMMGQGGWPNLDTVRAAVLGVNGDYEITFADGAEHEKDILVASC